MNTADLMQLLTPLVVVLVGAAIAYFQRKGYISADLARKLELDVQGAVASVQHEYVTAIKAANEDGVITPEEAQKARQMAYAKVMSIGKEKGIDYAKTYGISAIVGLIEKKVTDLK